jgi:pimeloyl-ACP methyl ester carboxylesterase
VEGAGSYMQGPPATSSLEGRAGPFVAPVSDPRVLQGLLLHTFDNLCIELTQCELPQPWTISDMATDAAALLEAVCEAPVVAIGQSMGAFIVTGLALDRLDLLRCVIASSTAATGGKGGLGDYMGAEIELRRNGGRRTLRPAHDASPGRGLALGR